MQFQALSKLVQGVRVRANLSVPHHEGQSPSLIRQSKLKQEEKLKDVYRGELYTERSCQLDGGSLVSFSPFTTCISCILLPEVE